jgi:hypothetical protein
MIEPLARPAGPATQSALPRGAWGVSGSAKACQCSLHADGYRNRGGLSRDISMAWFPEAATMSRASHPRQRPPSREILLTNQSFGSQSHW